jgi:hypothetical protein
MIKRRLSKIKLLLLMVLIMFGSACWAQQVTVQQKDLGDVLFKKKKSNKPKQDTLVVRKLYLSILPIPGYSPALGFVLGGGASANILLGDRRTTNLSSALANVTVTSKKQLNINIRTNVYTAQNNWIFQGDYRLLIFSQPTYGLGINFSKGGDFSINGASLKIEPNEQPMRFNYFRFYQNVYRKLKGSWYAGLGINIEHHGAIKDQSLDMANPKTAHYIYSSYNNFPLKKYTTNGITFNLLYDNRDNAVNPLNGYFAQLTFRVNSKFLGSSQSSSTIYYEYRTYIHLDKNQQNKHILALWIWGQFLTSGKLPYLATPSIGWDMYNRSGRGYIQGRIRGENLAYTEIEYRFPISKNGLLGGVTFVNATSASNKMTSQQIFDSYAVGYGFGLRVKMSKKTNTNICIDYGRGRNGAGGIFFNLQEVF